MLKTDETIRLHYYGDATTKQLAQEHQKIRQYIYHYTLSDLESILSDIRDIHSVIMKFTGFASSAINRQHLTDELYNQLLIMPIVREFLSPSSPVRKTTLRNSDDYALGGQPYLSPSTTVVSRRS
jgi:hypothetical protein